MPLRSPTGRKIKAAEQASTTRGQKQSETEIFSSMLGSTSQNSAIKSTTYLKSPRNKRSASRLSKRSSEHEDGIGKLASKHFISLASTLQRLNIKEAEKTVKTLVDVKVESPDESFYIYPAIMEGSEKIEKKQPSGSKKSATKNLQSARAHYDTCNIL